MEYFSHNDLWTHGLCCQVTSFVTFLRSLLYEPQLTPLLNEVAGLNGVQCSIPLWWTDCVYPSSNRIYFCTLSLFPTIAKKGEVSFHIRSLPPSEHGTGPGMQMELNKYMLQKYLKMNAAFIHLLIYKN